jgi:hypothetical protein
LPDEESITISTPTSDTIDESVKSNTNDEKRKLKEEASAKKAGAVNGISNPPPEPLHNPVKEPIRVRKARERQVEREKLIRTARRGLKAHLRPEWIGKPHVNETNMTKTERRARRKTEKAAKQQRRLEERKLEKAAENRVEEHHAGRTDHTQENGTRSQGLWRLDQGPAKAERRETQMPANDDSEAESANIPPTAEPKDCLATGGDEIKLRADRVNQPPANAKRQKKLQTQMRASDWTDHAAKSVGLSQKKLDKYAKTAELKGIVVENYIEKKVRKRLEKSENGSTDVEMADHDANVDTPCRSRVWHQSAR